MPVPKQNELFYLDFMYPQKLYIWIQVERLRGKHNIASFCNKAKLLEKIKKMGVLSDKIGF